MVDSYEREYRYRPGLGHSAPYQVSGHPFITGSVTLDSGIQSKVEFPGVAKSVTDRQSVVVGKEVYIPVVPVS